ncbi:MAG: type VI secretion system-associated protein TagF, partial [Planctomycetota bacterium]
MQLGLFGKLPSRGDFVTRHVAPEILRDWERWLEGMIQGARDALGSDWEPTYRATPVWRFWIGAGAFGGEALAGGLVPSQDSVGRRFPLCLILSRADAAHPAPPLAGEGNEDWYRAIDGALARLTQPGAEVDIERELTSVGAPTGSKQAQAEDGRGAFFAYGESGLQTLLSDVVTHDHQLASFGRSYWWTAGNETTGPAIIAQEGMPDVGTFVAMLRGFGPPDAETDEEALAEEMRAESAALTAAGWGALEEGDLSDVPPVDEIETPVEVPQEDGPSPFETEDGWSLPRKRHTEEPPGALGDTEGSSDETTLDEPLVLGSGASEAALEGLADAVAEDVPDEPTAG